MGRYSIVCKDDVVRPIIFRKANLPYGVSSSYKLFIADIHLADLYQSKDGWYYMLKPSKFFTYVDMPRAYSHNGGFKTRLSAAFFVMDLLQIHINQPKERKEQLEQHARYLAALNINKS